jgi:MoaA/NifB/PqqE/SkfB family radical SAM enzyme
LKAEQTKIAIDYMINAVCNLNCIFCYGPIFNKNVEMNFNLKLKLMDGLIRNGIRIMVIGGGEPFLSDDLAEFCKISNQKGLKIGIQTNGFF